MNKKKQNEAEQAYNEMSDNDKAKVTRLFRARIWFHRNGKNHALYNPYEIYA